MHRSLNSTAAIFRFARLRVHVRVHLYVHIVNRNKQKKLVDTQPRASSLSFFHHTIHFIISISICNFLQMNITLKVNTCFPHLLASTFISLNCVSMSFSYKIWYGHCNGFVMCVYSNDYQTIIQCYRLKLRISVYVFWINVLITIWFITIAQ